jgi:CO dehydrogenase maturation factor
MRAVPGESFRALAGLRIGVLGKGGSGKSTVVALLAQRLAGTGYDVVVLDADSTNDGLHRALGIAEPPRPLLELFGGSVFRGGAVTCPVDDPTAITGAHVRLADLADEYAKRSPDGVWLVVAGKLAEDGPGAGCDGPIAKIARDVEIDAGSPRQVTFVDLKAGLEDSSRGVILPLDAAIVVVDPSITAVRTAVDLTRLVEQVHGGGLPATAHLASRSLVAIANRMYREARICQVFVVLNRIADPATEAILRRALAAHRIRIDGVVREDADLAHAWLLGDRLDGQPIWSDLDTIIAALEAAFRTQVGDERFVRLEVHA